MEFNLEKACIGFLIGVLLFYVYNKIFLIEGVEMTFCAQGKNQNMVILNLEEFHPDS